MVSVVIPVYNSEKNIHECLDSLLRQTYKDFELICVNDGSRDNSLSILNEYSEKDSRIRVITKENEGKGAASARNMGLEHATGEYVIFLDSDDFFESNMLELLMSKANETEADVVVCGAMRYDDVSKKKIRPYATIDLSLAPAEVFSYKDCKECIFQLADTVTWNKLYRRELLIRNNLRFEAIPISDDQYVPALALVYADRIAVVNENLINYRYNTGGSQVDGYHKHPDSSYLAAYSIIDRMKETGIYEEVKRSYLNTTVRLLRDYFDRMADYETLQYLYEKYKNEVLDHFEAGDLPKNYFYDMRLDNWYRMIKNRSLEEILFDSCRAHGVDRTTEILRFQFPYDKVNKGSKIVLIGKGIIGKYWYSQLLLSEYAEVVYWADKADDIPQELRYDDIVYAK